MRNQFLEVKVNKEIRKHTEKIVWGLDLRETIFAALAVVSSVCAFVLCYKVFPLEVSSWICVIAALPCGFLGFFKWHDMPAEKIFKAILIDLFLEPKTFLYSCTSPHWEREEEFLKRREKNGVENIKGFITRKKSSSKKREKRNKKNKPRLVTNKEHL